MCMNVRNTKMKSKLHAARRGAVTLAAASLLGGCAMKGDVRDLQTEIRMLAARQDSLLAQLQAETQSTQDTLRTQTDQLFEFRGDINQSLRQIAQSLTRLEALAGENQRSITGIRDQLANMRRAPVVQPPLVVGDSTGGVRSGGESLVPGGGGNPDLAWRAATDQYDRGSINTARVAFQDFLQAHPGHENAPQAHFYLADILEQQDRPEEALAAFQRIPEQYPIYARMPEVLYRVANLQHALDDDEAAKATLERLINTYPNESTMVMLARGMLEEIG